MADENTQPQELTELNLAEMAESLDSTGSVDVPAEAQSPESTPDSEAAPTPESEAAKADKPTTNEPPNQEKGPGTEAAKQPTEEQTESAYLKAQKALKESERQDRSWKKLEEEKATLKREREALEAERQKVTKTGAARDEAGFTADEYETAAKTFETNGDSVMAGKARAKAEAIRQSAQTQAQEAQVNEIRQKWQETVNKVVEERPELKDANSPLGKKVAEVLRTNPIFSYTPDGFRRAVEHVELQDKAALVPGLQSELEALKKENERLNKLTSVGGSGVTQKPGEKTFESMSRAEQEAELNRAAEEADRQAA